MKLFLLIIACILTALAFYYVTMSYVWNKEYNYTPVTHNETRDYCDSHECSLGK